MAASARLNLNTSDFKALKYAQLADDYAHLMNVLSYEEALAFASENRV